MSNSLVRKSLELLDYEEDPKQEKKKKKRSKNRGVLDLIPTQHRIISKHDKTDLSTIFGRSKSISVIEAKKKLESYQDPTEANVQKLLTLSKNRIDLQTADKLLNRAVKKRIAKKEKPVEEERTVFTEEDFKKFENEYVG